MQQSYLALDFFSVTFRVQCFKWRVHLNNPCFSNSVNKPLVLQFLDHPKNQRRHPLPKKTTIKEKIYIYIYVNILLESLSKRRFEPWTETGSEQFSCHEVSPRFSN